nr:reverse transcriptase domain-containing protein [Tanacetum cinerariifolium]
MTLKEIKELINQRVAKALAGYKENHAVELAIESQSQNGDDDDNRNVGGNGNGNGRGNGDGHSRGNGNENGRGSGNGNPNRNGRGVMPIARKCTYHDFVKCQPLNFKETKGVFRLTRRFEKMKTIFYISNCLERDLMKLMTERFQELTMMCTKMVSKEEDQVGKFIRGLPDNIQGINEKKGYVGTLPYCNKCKLDHEGPCTMKYEKCNKLGHMTKDCMNVVATITTHRTPVVNPRVPTCFECGRQGHYRSECPKLKNQTRRNKAEKKTDEARGKAYVLGGREANPDSNVFTSTFLLINHYASMLFDSGADISFISSTFSALLDVISSTLDVSYVVELDDGRILEINTVLRVCTLGSLGHPFSIDLMPVELGSFDVIIGIDWLAKHHAVTVYDEKIV